VREALTVDDTDWMDETDQAQRVPVKREIVVISHHLLARLQVLVVQR
jgi:hypothetical protein